MTEPQDRLTEDRDSAGISADADTSPQAFEAGTISRFQTDKGYGFIARYGAPDLFFHVSDFSGPAAILEAGLRVRFEIEPSRKKPGTSVAVRVHPRA